VADSKDLIPLLDIYLPLGTALQTQLQVLVQAIGKQGDVPSCMDTIQRILSTIPRQLSKPQRDWKNRFDPENALSNDRFEHLRTTMSSKYGDSATVMNDARGWLSTTADVVITLNNFKRGISKEETQLQQALSAKDVLLVGFLAGRSLKHFAAGLDAWSDITVAFGRMVGQPQEHGILDVRGLLIHVELGSGMLDALAFAVDKLLAIIEQSRDRDKTRELLRIGMQEANSDYPDIDGLVEKVLIAQRQKELHEVVDELLSRYEKAEDGEMRNLLYPTLTKMVRHLDDGGSVGFTSSSSSEAIPTEAVGRVNARFELAIDGTRTERKQPKALPAGK
jgi:hypothetical protein